MRKLKNNELGRISVENFKKEEKTPIVVVLDNVRSAFNVGSVFEHLTHLELKGSTYVELLLVPHIKIFVNLLLDLLNL